MPTKKSSLFKIIRSPYAPLIIALALFLFSNGRWIVPVATWLFPVFLMRYLRSEKNKWRVLISTIVYLGLFCISWNGLIKVPGILYFAVAGGIGFATFIPFLVDKALSPRIKGFTATLVFPLAYTVIEFIGFKYTPYGTWGSLAYTQFGNLPLMQLASITGIYGITFLITWFASVVNWAWEMNFDWPKINLGVKKFAAVLSIVLIFGGLSLVLLAPKSDEVKIAGVQSGITDEVLAEVNKSFDSGDFSEKAWKMFFDQTDLIIEDLFVKSEIAAKGGAQIVAWSENQVMVAQDKEKDFLDRAKKLAEKEKIYLVLNYSINLGKDPSKAPAEKIWSTRTIFISPDGAISPAYRKTILVPGMETTYAVAGNDEATEIETPYGKLSSLICFDNDFPSFVKNQVGNVGADIHFIPTGDWKEIDPYHTNMSAFRAIENGFSVVKVTSLGLSAVYDYQGRTVSTMDYFKTKDKVFTAFVPKKGVTTIYSKIGDLFAWLCVLGLVVILGKVVLKKRF